MLIFIRIIGILCQLLLTLYIYKVEGSQSLVLFGFLAGVLNFSQLSDLGVSYICRQRGEYLSSSVLRLLLGWILFVSLLISYGIVCTIDYADAQVHNVLTYCVVATGGLMFIQSIYFNRYKDTLVYAINPAAALLAVFAGLTVGCSIVPVYFSLLFLSWLALMVIEICRKSLPGKTMDRQSLWVHMRNFSMPSSANRLSAMSTTSLVQILLPLVGEPAFVASYLLLVRPAQSFRTLYIALAQRYWTNQNVGRTGFPIKVSSRLTVKSANSLNFASSVLIVLALGVWWLLCKEIIGLEAENHHWIILIITCSYIILILTELRVTQALIDGFVRNQAQAGIASLVLSLIIFKALGWSNVQGWFVLFIPLINRGLKVGATFISKRECQN